MRPGYGDPAPRGVRCCGGLLCCGLLTLRLRSDATIAAAGASLAQDHLDGVVADVDALEHVPEEDLAGAEVQVGPAVA